MSLVRGGDSSAAAAAPRSPAWVSLTARAAQWMRGSSLLERIGVGIAVFLFVILVNAAFTVTGLGHLDDLARNVRDRDLPAAQASTDATSALSDEAASLQSYVLTGDPSARSRVAAASAAYTAAATRLHRLVGRDSAVGPAVQGMDRAVSAWRSGYETPQLNAGRGASSAQLRASVAAGNRLFQPVRAAESNLGALILAHTSSDLEIQSRTRAQLSAVTLISSLVGAFVGTVLLLVALGSVLHPLNALREVARDLREDRPITIQPPPGPPEFREVHAAIASAGFALQERQAELLHAKEELERASSLKSDFLATMSHELRTPLNAILGFTELMRSGQAGPMSPVAIDFLERVGRNGRLLLDLINDVLDLSKIEAGRLTLHLQPVAVGAMVKQVLHGAQPLADSKGLALSLEDHTEAAMALADPRALSQIVTNLVGNSVKFTDKGWIRIDIHAERGRLLIDIADTGPGIAMEDQDAIFEAFRQVGEESRSGKGGSGLGLAISSRLASQMGGALTVRSQVGLGSTFRLELPAARATPSVAEARSQGPLVLAIDDDFDALALWQAQVERLGFTFVGLQAPGSAAQAAMDLQPAVVLLDILFPDGSGWDVLQKLRDEPATASIPVLIISVTDDDRLGDRTGITFLQKPLSEARLAAVLQPFRSAKIVAAR